MLHSRAGFECPTPGEDWSRHCKSVCWSWNCRMWLRLQQIQNRYEGFVVM